MGKNDEHLIGKSKLMIVNEIGQEFNYFPDSIWTYHLKDYWWGQKKMMILYFEDDVVKKVKIKRIYGKVKNSKL